MRSPSEILRSLLRVSLLAISLLPSLQADPMAMVGVPEYRAEAPDFAVDELLSDDDEGMGSFSLFASQFNPETGTGSLLALDGEGGYEDLQERKGELVEHLYEMQIGESQMLLVVWRSLEESTQRSLEIWSNNGYPALVWGGIPRISWSEAKVVVREKSGRWLVQVTRSLLAENASQPALRSKEIFEVTEQGLKRLKQRRQEVTNPEQRLNVIADLAQTQEWEEMIAQVKQLPRRQSEYLQRAALILTRSLPQGRDQLAADRVLEILAAQSRSDKIATAAGDQLLERAWSRSAGNHGPELAPQID